MTFPSERCVYVLRSLLFHRDDPAEDQAAVACHHEMFEALLKAGYSPHLLGIQSKGKLLAAEDHYAAIWQRLKQAFDPSAIFAPGRYES